MALQIEEQLAKYLITTHGIEKADRISRAIFALSTHISCLDDDIALETMLILRDLIEEAFADTLAETAND